MHSLELTNQAGALAKPEHVGGVPSQSSDGMARLVGPGHHAWIDPGHARDCQGEDDWCDCPPLLLVLSY